MKKLKVYAFDRVYCPDPEQTINLHGYNYVIAHHSCFDCPFYVHSDYEEDSGRHLFVNCKFDNQNH